ncbi:MAG TPA: immunoglobulin domain-containing protein [Verrucomicrobiae bacterium]|jgi:hypothetical protein
MKKLTLLAALVLFGSLVANAQIVFPPGKLAVLKAGDNTGYWNINSSKAQPCFVQVFDTVSNNQASPTFSLALPTNAPNALWINAHSSSEGGGISRAANRQYLAIQGYTGDIISPTNSKPSTDPTISRGFGIVDVFGNENVVYSDTANWFGMPSGVTQNNPTGIATEDGVNFWGTGDVNGAGTGASGALFFNANVSTNPVEFQNDLQEASEARIIGGALYVVVPGGGVYNFLDPQNNNAVVPLPFDPSAPNPVSHTVVTNLFLDWGSTFQNIANFDMNAAGTIAYGADQRYGIVKFVNTSGVWQPAPYYFSSTNLGTTKQSSGNEGCFGICVDFTGLNPIIYATTAENGTTPPKNSQGNANQNRIIRIVDDGTAPGTKVVAQTLATAQTTNENFRGIDFAPEVIPLITSEPASYSTTVGGAASFSVTAQSVYPLTYQWFQNNAPLLGETNATLTFASVSGSLNMDVYQCVVSNAYGVVTTAPPATLTVTLGSQPPVITNSPAFVSNYVGSQITFDSVSPTGTSPFTFQWYFAGAPLSDASKYAGSTNSSLTIFNLSPGDAGSYSLVASNSAGIASNVVDILTVLYHPPSLTPGEPASATAFVSQPFTLTATANGGTLPLTYQWYKGATALQDTNQYSGSHTNILTINPVSVGDGGSYSLVVSNPGGSVTSQVATVTVIAPAVASFVAYSNAASNYTQNFDSLPYEPTKSVNADNPVTINGVTYSLNNPFDFAFSVEPVATGGLGLSNTMTGWYGLGNAAIKFGASEGDQTTGGILSFGLTNNATLATNRSLGLIATSSTGPTAFGLRLINQTGYMLGQFNLSYTSELWRQAAIAKAVTNFYYLDLTGTNGFLTNIVAGSLTNLMFSTGAATRGINGPIASNYVVFANQSFATNWPPGAALWVVWEMDDSAGSAQGIGIDDLTFSADIVTNLAPVITTAPESVSVSPGQTATFSVLVSNLLSGGFQWYTNGGAISDGNEFSGATTGTLVINPTSTTDDAFYTVVVSNAYGSVTSQPVTLTVASTALAPIFDAQPQGVTAFVGADVVISVSVDGTLPLAYQWLFNGTNVPGATTDTIELTNVMYTNAGSYTVLVTNSVGTNLSQPAILAVVAQAPQITVPPSSQTITAGGTVIFTVTATGTAPLQYQWLWGGDPLSDGAGIFGSQSNILTLTGIQPYQGGSYSVQVSNPGDSPTSAPAILTVVSANPSQLSIVNNAGNAFVWWPASAGTNLQVTSDLQRPWAPSGYVITTTGSTNSVTVTISATNQLFRLAP